MKSLVKAFHFFVALGIYLIPMWLVFQINITDVTQQVFFLSWLTCGWIASAAYYSEVAI